MRDGYTDRIIDLFIFDNTTTTYRPILCLFLPINNLKLKDSTKYSDKNFKYVKHTRNS